MTAPPAGIRHEPNVALVMQLLAVVAEHPGTTVSKAREHLGLGRGARLRIARAAGHLEAVGLVVWTAQEGERGTRPLTVTSMGAALLAAKTAAGGVL